MAISRSTKLVAVKKNNSNAITIYTGWSNWETVSNVSEGLIQFQAILPVTEDDIDCCHTRRKIATVYASRPNPRSDLVYLRFYVYSDKMDSKRVSD